MAIDKSKLMITQDDLLGYDLKDIACHQCSAICTLHAGRILDGKVVLLCTQKPAAVEVLSHIGKRG